MGYYGHIAQLVEQEPFKLKVVGSIPTRPTYLPTVFVFNNENGVLKIILISSTSIYLFYILINFFDGYLTYNSELKLFTIILLVVITILIYILITLLTKTFKYSDIKLKY